MEKRHCSVSLYISLEMNGLPGCPWELRPRCHIVAIGPAHWWLSLSSACVTAWALCLSARRPYTPHPLSICFRTLWDGTLHPEAYLSCYGSHDCIIYRTSLQAQFLSHCATLPMLHWAESISPSFPERCPPVVPVKTSLRGLGLADEVALAGWCNNYTIWGASSIILLWRLFKIRFFIFFCWNSLIANISCYVSW